MGGGPVTVRWRNIDVDPDTAAMLAAIAKDVGNDIFLEGIPGFGSYRTNAASGGTDTGGGHADLNLVGYSPEQCRRAETMARSKGATAYWRPALRPDGTRYGWQDHLHILRTDCGDLSQAARNQVQDYLNGYDGLYYGYDAQGRAKKMPDSGVRSFTGRRWLTLSAPVAPAPSTPVVVAKSSLEEDTLSHLLIKGGQPNTWTPVVVPNDGRTYRVSLAYGGGGSPKHVEMLVFARQKTVQTPSRLSRSMNWDWQRDVPGDITLNPGEGSVSIRWNGTADQNLSVSLVAIK